jgi:hypothetical protein
MAEIITCPACERQLQVPVSFYGQTVQCPECSHLFVAEPPAESVQPAPKAAAPVPEERPRRSKRAYDRDDDYDDDFDHMRPLRTQGRPHRGGLILALGIMALVGGVAIGFPFALGPVAWLMGNSDLAEIHAGRMDPSGEGMIQAGRVLGMISTFLLILGVVFVCGIVGLIFVVHAH